MLINRVVFKIWYEFVLLTIQEYWHLIIPMKNSKSQKTYCLIPIFRKTFTNLVKLKNTCFPYTVPFSENPDINHCLYTQSFSVVLLSYWDLINVFHISNTSYNACLKTKYLCNHRRYKCFRQQ